MLTDVIVEEGFDRDEEELWYSRKDLERDLHLAAELGKTLLDRNHELEQGLQQMYSTNQEQLQEIEYLTKQVDLLRQMNDQHAKVYEQLDLAARDLEKSNQRLVQENRTAQHRIQSLTETIDGLQTQMENLQKQVGELKTSQSWRDLTGARQSLGSQSMSCLKELYDLQQDKNLSSENLREKSCPALDDRRLEEDNSTLQHTLHTLKAQLANERARRMDAERETELTVQENGALEQRLNLLEGARRRQAELEAEVEELRQLWRSESSSTRPTDTLMPDNVFFASEERVGQEEEEGLEAEFPNGRRRCSSESYVRGSRAEDIRHRHDRTCIRRAQVVKQRGISLLNEVDAQYSALQVKYDELLRRCQQGADSLSHKAVQTPTAHAQRRRSLLSIATTTESICPADELHQPEYKALFKEIFTCIQKTKEDLSENRAVSQAQ